MNNQKGVIALAPLAIIVILIILALIYFIFLKGIVKNPVSKSSPKQEPIVTLKTDYNNPFNKDAQYVNPFATYKNPFDSLK